MPAHTGGRDAEPFADVAGGDRPGLQQQLDYCATRVAVNLRPYFHNTIVTEFVTVVQEGRPIRLGDIGHYSAAVTLLRWQSAALAP